MSGTIVYNPFTDNLDYRGASGGGGGGISTINSVGPDGGGDYTLTSGDGSVTFTPTANGQDLSATGAFTNEYFSVYLGSPTVFVTGDGTLYGPILFDGVVLNSSSSYNTATGIYTAPSSGVYVFNHTICFSGGGATTDNYLTFFRGNTWDYRAFQLSPIAQVGGNTEIFSSTFMVSLAAGDTMSVWVLASGGGLDMRIYGAAPIAAAATSLFSGYKIA